MFNRLVHDRGLLIDLNAKITFWLEALLDNRLKFHWSLQELSSYFKSIGNRSSNLFATLVIKLFGDILAKNGLCMNIY